MTRSIADHVIEGASSTTGGRRPFGMYIHVPWCSSRCGYCDFNTYVPSAIAGANPDSYVDDAIAEIRYAAQMTGAPTVDTVFFGGGTPTLLGPADLSRMLQTISDEFGLSSAAEVTTEANPESVDRVSLEQLRAAGFNRISVGMQSAVPAVLATLEREHTAGRATQVVNWAKQAGFEQVSLDLIYGAPGETDADWHTTVSTALDAEPTHISAYSLIVEPGTRMARQVASGQLMETDQDVLADRYWQADELFTQAGLDWYEVSNFGQPCRHNLGYWQDGQWWGIGPGAHSYRDGRRWWNVKHPRTYAEAVRALNSVQPQTSMVVADSERLTPEQELVERVMLGIRLREGIPDDQLTDAVLAKVPGLIQRGLLDQHKWAQQRVAMRDSQRLLADLVARELL